MKALILAGGFATRLRPLSCSKPKLLFPIVGTPLIDVMIDWLKTGGVSEVILALNHMADQLRNEIGEKRNGVKINYSIEKQPLGTGGPLRLAKNLLGESEPFIVLNGDIVTNLDLQQMIEHHGRIRHTFATIALVSVEDASAYGLVRIDKNGRIKSFDEKTKSAVGQGLINAGVYILSPEVLERIPDGGMVSIERQVFPALAHEDLMQGWDPNGEYWYDIGKIPDYVRVNRELLEHWWKESMSSSNGEKPLYIGSGSKIDGRARIGPYSILSRDVTVKAGSTVRDAIIFEETVIEENSHIDGAIIGERVRVGSNTTIGPGTLVAGQISIPPGTRFEGQPVLNV